MLSIGDFARHGQVSVRMLRHYDALGLLTPAHVDPATGYRSYRAGQLARLNRVVALKELGFTLEQVRQILDEKVSGEALRGMLTLRRAELENQIAADRARLGHVEARLRMIESEGRMPTDDVIVKSLPAVRVAELSATAGGYTTEQIGPVVQSLYAELTARLERAAVPITGPGIAYYEDADDGGVVVHAAVTISAESGDRYDFAIVDLPAVPAAATLVHRGAMAGLMPSYDALARWMDDHDYRPSGPSREYYLATEGDQDTWVTELQTPVTAERESGA